MRSQLRREMGKKEELAKIVGSENVFDDNETLEIYSLDMSFTRATRPLMRISPKTADEVGAIVNWANETLTPLVPISSGAPHFRGDTVPTSEGACIVDLSSLKKILRVSRKERVAMFEPGVTFGELQRELIKNGLRLNMPLLPRGSKSVVGSLLEREPVTMPAYHWDSSDPLGCVEIVFGNGDLFRTGAAAGPGTIEAQWQTGEAQKQPGGPGQADIHRLIQGSQGTMGIVTWATARCELLPALEAAFLVSSPNLESLFGFIHWLVRLRLVNECLVLNNVDLASIIADKPGDYLRLRDYLLPWILCFSMVGYQYFPEERLDYQIEKMNDVAEKQGIEVAKSINETCSADKLLKVLQYPSTEPYWKLRHKGACSDIFCLTNYNKIPKLVEIMNNLATENDYPISDIGIYLQPVVQGTSCHCEFNLFFDPKQPEEVERTQKLYRAASKSLMANGGFFSRPYGSWADMAYERDGETATALRKIKQIFDPNNIMNRGKLCFK